MRWLKHLTSAHDDPELSAIAEEFGAEGYGIYWLILEHIGQSIERDSEAIPSRTHSVVKWASICHCSPQKFRKFCNTAAERNLLLRRTSADVAQFQSRKSADRLQIDVPKLLKYRDEYSKKSGQSTSQIEKEIEIERQRQSQMSPPSVDDDTPPPRRPLVRTLPKPKPIPRAANVTEADADFLSEIWIRWKRQRRDQPMNLVAGLLLGRDDFDWDRFRQVAPRYAEYCESMEPAPWKFASLTLLEWIDGGMIEPPLVAANGNGHDPMDGI